MILHCVFCNFRADACPEERLSILQELADFSRSLDGVLAFNFGPNRDFERKSPEFSAGFVIRFKDRKALEVYAAHPTHQEIGARLCDLCNSGAKGVMVFDIEDAQA